MAGTKNDAGVSVIIGTLLLILITVTAAAGLAMMVSQMQKDEMNRQTHLTAVKSEKIEIQNIQMNNNRTVWNQTPPYYTEPTQPWNNWSSITFTLSNINIDDVKVIGIAINDRYTRNYSTVTDTPNPARIPYNMSNGEYLALPGSKSQKVQINFTDDFANPQYIQTDNQVRIRVMTSLYNNFEKIIKQPNPVFTTKIETIDPGKPDTLILDGSQSTADSTILSYYWTIYDLNWTTPNPGNETDEGNYIIHNQTFQGRMVRTNNLNNTQNYRVMLTISDAFGMSATSPKTIIPSGNFNPPVSILVNWTPWPTCGMNVTILDRLNNGVFEQPVDIDLKRNTDNYPFLWKLYSPSNGMTSSSGTIFFNVSGNATVTIISAKLERPYKFEENNCSLP